MRILGVALGFILCLTLLLPVSSQQTSEQGKIRLFILSGQSNMSRLNPATTFTPALQKAFAKDEIIVVKSAQGGQPIRRWYKGWKAPEGVAVKTTPGKPGDLYDLLLDKVKSARKDKKIDTITFVWMQGESDAKRGTASVYEASLRGLIQQLRNDLQRPDLTVVIGRLNDYKKGQAGWDTVRKAQEKVATEDPLAGWVDTDNLDGAIKKLHHSVRGYDEMGRRFAAAAIQLLSARRP